MPEFIHVNSEDTLKKLNSNKKDKFVKYYMDGCGHCEDLEPIWKLVENRIKKENDNNNVIIVQLNANFMDNADVPNVEGFPTISMIKGGRKIEHKGARTEDAIMDFFKKNNLLTNQTGGGRRRKYCRKKATNMVCSRGTKKQMKKLARYSKKIKMKLTRCSKKRLKSKRRNKRRNKRKRKTVRKRKKSNTGKGFVKWFKSKLPTTKVKPQTAVIGSVKESDDNYEIARLNREGNRLLNNIRQPPSPWYDTDAAKLEFDQNKRLYERIMKDAPVAEVVEENPETVDTRPVTNLYYNPKTNDGRNDNFVVVSSRRRRGRNTNRVVPISGGKRKKKQTKRKKNPKKAKPAKQITEAVRTAAASHSRVARSLARQRNVPRLSRAATERRTQLREWRRPQRVLQPRPKMS